MFDPVPNVQADCHTLSESNVLTPPVKEALLRNGQTIFYVKKSTDNPKWFAIRATQKRGQKVADSLQALQDDSLDIYFPMLKHVVYSNEDFDNPTKTIVDVPVDPNLLFVRCTLDRMLYYMYDECRPKISGLTPYYNHCMVNSFGKNELLVVPDVQLQSFRIIVESGNDDIILNESISPDLLNGDSVVVTGVPFAGVHGVVVKYKHQKRVVVQLDGIGMYGTSYVPKDWLRKV